MNKINTLLILLVSIIFVGCSKSNNESYVIVTYDNEYNTDIISTSNPITRPMLVVLVSYNDVQIKASLSAWNSKIFGNSEGQLNHYYNEISNSKFAFTQATEAIGVASVRLFKNHPNLTIDDYASFSSGFHPDLKSALEKLDDDIAFDVYDTNADGHITPDELVITFIIAGYEDAYEGMHVDQGVWGHQSCVNSTNTATLDGVTMMGCIDDGNYALFGERHNQTTPHMATIGIIAHELGHSAFSLPDLYNTTFGATDTGIGAFGLMAYGTWTQKNNIEYAGQTPTHMCAWSKVYNGWVTPDNTNGLKTMNATSLNSFNTVKININADEYYLLENRDNAGYDRGLYLLNGTFNGGLAIWHIDNTKLTADKLSSNTVNADDANRAVDLVEAANANIDLGGIGDEANLFYSGNVDSFNGEGANEANVTAIGVRGQAMSITIN